MKRDEFVDTLKKLKGGDKTALSSIYHAYFSKIYFTAFWAVKNRDDAYDIAMNVIMRLCDYAGDPAQVRNPDGLMATMTKNEANDYFRRKRHCVVADMERLEVSKTETDTLWMADLADCLTEWEREILIEHVVWGKQLKEIAQAKGKPYIRLKREYAAIKKKIKKLYK